MIGSRMARGFAGFHSTLNGGLKILPTSITQRDLQIAGKPEFNAFGIRPLGCGFQILLQGLQLFIHHSLPSIKRFSRSISAINSSSVGSMR